MIVERRSNGLVMDERRKKKRRKVIEGENGGKIRDLGRR